MKHSLSLTIFVLFASAFCYSYPSGMESQTVQNWETAQIDSKITIDLNKSGLYLPTDRNAAIRLIQQNRSSLLKNAYLSILVDSSHRLGSYLAEEKISLTDINTVINNGKHGARSFSRIANSHCVPSKSFARTCQSLCKTQCAVYPFVFSPRYSE